MKKIKTITCHDVYNVGASLQAYALQEYLKSLGHDVEIIDYKPEYLVHYKLTGIANIKYDKPILREIYTLIKFPGRLKARLSKRKRKFDFFTQNFLTVTDISYSSNEKLKSNPPIADIYFAGSDQIWNTLFQNGRDPAFYLEFVPQNAIKASYAASFATEDIVEEYKPQVKKWLSDMDYISVREKNGISIINNLGVKNVIQVLDPVFLLKKDRWIEMETKLEISEPYILLYDFDCNEKIGEYTRKVAKKNGWKVYSILKNPYCDRDFEQEGPTEFLWLIDHSEFVISNSFHATAFSIIFEKQFEVFERKEDINTRIRELVKSLDLENRILNEKKIQQTQSELIEYKIVRTLLEKNIVESQNYIKDVCNSKKE